VKKNFHAKKRGGKASKEVEIIKVVWKFGGRFHLDELHKY
jgi:hypothetical protein